MSKPYRFTVGSHYPFPVDMLRYDACYPSTSEDASTISESLRRERDAEGNRYRQVTLVGPRAPTVGRWQSFLWQIVPTEGNL